MLEYQKRKRNLVKKVIGIDLLEGGHLALKPYNLKKDAFPKLWREFDGAKNLVLYNNAYCVIQDYNCKKCPYRKRCDGRGSLLTKSITRWNRVDKRHKRALKKLGEELREALIPTYKEVASWKTKSELY